MTYPFTTLPLLLLMCLQLLNPGAQSINGSNIVNQSLPEGYVAHPEFGVAYKVYHKNVSWSNASVSCVEEDAELAVIDSYQKLKYATLEPLGKGVRHVGIQWVHNRWSGHSYWASTTNGYVWPSIPWAKNEPHELKTFDCVMVGWKDTVHGLISGDRYNFYGDYICQKRIPGTVKESRPILPFGYIPYRDIGVAYKVHGESIPWNVARKLCIHEGAELAVIDSEKKLDYAVHQQNSVNGRMHVGMRLVEHQWVRASNGEPLTSIPVRYDSMPKNLQCGHDCAILVNETFLIGSCNDEATEFICEIPLPDPVPAGSQTARLSQQVIMLCLFYFLHHLRSNCCT